MSTIPKTAPFADDTLVSEIDGNDPWFNPIVADQFYLPGEFRAPDSTGEGKRPNKVTNGQLGIVIRGMQEVPTLNVLPLQDALDVARRDRTMGRMNAKQYDINLVNYFQSKANEANADAPQTTGQMQFIDTNIRALLGKQAHFNSDVQKDIDALTAEQRAAFVVQLEELEVDGTQGAFSLFRRRYDRYVRDPRVTTQQAQSTAAQAVANLSIETEGEESF